MKHISYNALYMGAVPFTEGLLLW